MKIFLFLLTASLISSLVATDSFAAFVQYRDEHGKVHHVNTEYGKVPERYRAQVEAQLRAIEERKNPPAPPIAVQSRPPAPEPIRNIPQKVTIDTTPPIPITDQNRLNRFMTVTTDLQTFGIHPPSVDIGTAVFYYTDSQGKKNKITPATLSTVPREFLPQIDTQIINFERAARQVKNKKLSTPESSRIEVYTKANCNDCVRLLTLLQVHKIPYLNYDINHTENGKIFYQSTGNAALPITKVKGQVINGVNVGAIKNVFQSN